MIFLKKKKTLVTHNGSFHADDVFACATLVLYCKQNHIPYRIIRTRDEKIIQQGDYVFDVGGLYNPEENHFDHHQSGGAGKRDNGIPYAAFGLVWKKFGPLLCSNKGIVRDIDRRLVQPIDAIDNGINITEPIECGLYDYGVHGIISAYQNTWKEFNSKKQYQNFVYLVNFFEKLLGRELSRSEDHNEMVALIEKLYQQSESKEILEVPYHVTINALMSVLESHKEVLYVVSRSNVNWKVLAVRKDMCSFENRKPLPESWSGKRNKELQDITGVSDALFCHNACFMAVAQSKEGAWQLARLALEHE